MADSTIFDLTAETVLTAAHEFVTQDTSAATRAQAATFALMGGLAYSASAPNANVTATVGTLHALDISGFTADRNFVLPDSAQVGERIGVFLTVGDDAFELDIVTAATGSEINGANAGGGTSWSRLFITNESVVFRCIKAGGAGDTDWIVEPGGDGRIPCKAGLHESASGGAMAQTSQGAYQSVNWGVSNEVEDRGDIIDQTLDSNVGGFRLRRSSRYIVSWDVYYDELTTDFAVASALYVDGTELWNLERGGFALLAYSFPKTLQWDFVAGSTMSLQTYQVESTSESYGAILQITEVL